MTITNAAQEVQHRSLDEASATAQSVDRVLIGAGILAALTTLLHVVGGGISVARPLLSSSLEQEPRLTMYAVWHVITFLLGISAVVFAIAALPRFRDSLQNVVAFTGILWVGMGVVFVLIAATEEGDGLFFGDLAQWTFLTPIGLFAIWGALRQPRDRNV